MASFPLIRRALAACEEIRWRPHVYRYPGCGSKRAARCLLSRRGVNKSETAAHAFGTPRELPSSIQAGAGTGDTILGLGLRLKLGVHQAQRVARCSPAASGGTALITTEAAAAAAGRQAATGLRGGHLHAGSTVGKARAFQLQVLNLQRGWRNAQR